MKAHPILKGCQVWLLPLLLTLPGLYLLLLYGLHYTDDALTHLWRIARMHDSIQNHMLFPRWIPEMLLGYGYPLLNYYASSTYYLVEIFSRAGLDLHKGFIAAQCLLVWLAAVGMVLFARDTFKRQTALAAFVAGVAYAYAPYLFVNIYRRSAIAEIGAQALLPWIFWSFQRIWRAEKPLHYIVLAILTLGGLAFTHTISLLIVPPLLIAYLIVLAFSTSEPKSRLIYSIVALAGAMGISCFFWGPLLVERGYVAYTGFSYAKERMLPDSFLTVGSLIAPELFYDYMTRTPWPLGLVQSSAALMGILTLIWKIRTNTAKDASIRNEWFFWIAVATLCIVMRLEVTKPLWTSNDILPIIQFPWRLLGVLQIPIALLTGLTITMVRPRVVQVMSAVALMVILIVVHVPHRTNLLLEYSFDAQTAQYNMAINAYYDAIRGTIIEGHRDDLASQEFRPLWAERSMTLDTTTVVEDAIPPQEAERTVQLLAAHPYHFQMAVESAAPFVLRLASYFFPGWAAILDGGERLTTYPSTNLGLLTVDMPAGKHTVDVVWLGTPVQFWSGLISQIAFFLLCLASFWWRRLRRWLWLMVPLLLVGLVATYLQPQLLPLQTTKLASSPPGLDFLGYTAPEVGEKGVHISTYWWVTKTQPTSIKTRWQIRSEDGNVVQEIVAKPYYNGYSFEYWASNTLVDDGYWLSFPPGLAAGAYQIQMTLQDEESGAMYDTLDVGTIAVPRATERIQPTHPLEVRFGDHVLLTGYDIEVVEAKIGREQSLAIRPEIPILYPGQTLSYRLYWRTNEVTNKIYAGFIHLLDHRGIAHVQQDQAPGPLLQPSAIWTLYGTYPDSYMLTIPDTMPSGLYTPNVGMYDWRDEHRFDVTVPGVEGVFDHYELPPIKVINPNVQPIGTKASARFGEFAELTRYQVEIVQADGRKIKGEISAENELQIRPGDRLTLTTLYKAQAPSPSALTRFVQVRNAQNQILAQYDGQPQEGANPSWAWVPGEIIADVVSITLPTKIPDQQYTLYVGWYDAAADLARVPTLDRENVRFANDEYPLLTLSVAQ